MRVHDPYDPRVAFDDLVGVFDDPIAVDTNVVGQIVRRVQHRRLATPMRVLGANFDSTEQTFEVPRVLGADDAPTGLVIYDSLCGAFSSAIPGPKMVRVDDDASYADFRSARRAPYIDKLDARLTALEAAFGEHADDAAAHCVAEAANGGEPIPMPRGTAAWRDGGEILCTIRTRGNDGKPRLVTTGVPLKNAIEEVVIGGTSGDTDFESVIGLVPVLACVLGASGLVPQLCRAMPSLLTCDTPSVGVLVSDTDPKLAAAMALLQQCQQGNQRACAEALALRDARKKLMKHAAKRLEYGQSMKARRRT